MKRPVAILIALTVVAGLCTAYAACRWLLPHRAEPQPWQMGGEWLTTADAGDYTGHFRSSIWLDAKPVNAWLAVAAMDGFELSVNGRVLGRESLWRPNRGYQFTNRERGQRISDARGVPSVSYARETQWENFASYRLPTFFDLRPLLRAGRNVICLKIASRKAPASVCVDGEVLLASGHRVALRSDESWKASALPRPALEREWTDQAYSDRDWPVARRIDAPGETYRLFDPDIFRAAFAAKWLRPASGTHSQWVWLEGTWDLASRPADAWLRLIANRPYDLYINGARVDPPASGSDDLAMGQWVVSAGRVRGAPSAAHRFDPDSADGLFDDDAEADLDPEGAVTASLAQDFRISAFDAVSVGPMLRAGPNRIAIRLDSRDELLKWSPRVALDGRATWHGGSSAFATSGEWTVRAEDSPPQSAVVAGDVGAGGIEIPRVRYLGFCHSSRAKLWAWLAIGGVVMLGFAGAAAGVIRFAGLRREKGTAILRHAIAGMANAATVLVCALALNGSFAVRDEALWMQQRGVWLAILLLAATGGGLGAWLSIVNGRARSEGRGLWRRYGFAVALAAVLLLCGLSRIHRLEFQPTDADEWASLQTILAVADTGTPRLIDDVYYTRSPLYHYLVGASVAVFGRNAWALRFPSALFAVATCGLLYLCGRRLLGSRWVGLGAAALFTLHPLMINIGHQVRFYQQQQFFALLTVYYFCRGFVVEQSIRARYLTLAAFFAAVFSQEISVMIAATLLPSYLLFAQRKSWSTEAKWLLTAGCGAVFVALDFVIFQTACLTQVEGVSPRIEPAIKLNFMYPSTLYWIFSLYSRLHLGLSVVFFAGLGFALRRANRAVVVLYLTFFAGLVLTTILISGTGLRFQYWLFPIFILLAVHGAKELAAFIFEWGDGAAALRGRGAQFAMATMLVLMIGLSWSPWKIPGSYTTKLMPDVDGALAYVRQHLASADAVAVTAPHTAATLVELGRATYDIEVPLLNDFVVRRDGRLIDRNAGAEVIGRLDDLQDACARHDRLWVILNRDIRLRSTGQRIAWTEPGGRFDLFVRDNLELKHQTYLTDVFLWDSSRGRLSGFRRNP